MFTPPALAERLQPVLAASPEVLLAYLFGSHAAGHPGPLSDLDLGILFERFADPIHAPAALAHRLTLALQGPPIDLVSLNQAPIELAYAVIAHGICIYRQDEATRVEFEAQTLSRYGDFLPVLRAMRTDILSGEKHERRIQRYREALRRAERTFSQVSRSIK